MSLYLQWIIVGVVIAACILQLIRRRSRKSDCECGCTGCSLKDKCNERRNPGNDVPRSE